MFEFDDAKNAPNIKLRGMAFERLADLDFDTAITIDDTRRDYGERRMRVIGFIDGRLHVAVVTPRGERIRIISLRRANRREEKAYAQEHNSSR